MLRELEVWNAVTQQAASCLVLVEHGDGVAHTVKAVGCHKTGRSGTNDRNTLAVTREDHRLYIVLVPCCLCNGSLVLAVGDRSMIGKIEHASLFAERRTDAAGKFGEVVSGIEQTVSQFPVALAESVVPFRILIAQRTSPMAERHAAVHAAAGLSHTVTRVESLLYLAKVVYSFVQRTIPGFQPGHFHESF